MSCSVCGEHCRCAPQFNLPSATRTSRARFEPDRTEQADERPVALIDPEPFDASEEQFAASLNGDLPRRVAVETAEATETPGHRFADEAIPQEIAVPVQVFADNSTAPTQRPLLEAPDDGSWRNEVAARVRRYRSRQRPRAPRYPSLTLKFETREPAETPSFRPELQVTAVARHALAIVEEPLTEVVDPQPARSIMPETAKILEFPRSAAMPPQILDELAEPVLDRPRILEVPEVQPAPPAMGGILIESAAEPAIEKQPGVEVPLHTVSIQRRLRASAVDGVLVLAAFAAFAWIFFRITATVPPLREGLTMSAFVLASFWLGYQYLLMVYAGRTPGLMAARLELSRFDGSSVPRRLRRWRVLASALAGGSVGLGYAWCFLDEDQLCWHDRITRTCMMPKQKA